jgi:hypothetical protein
VNAPESSTMSGSHILIQCLDSIGAAQFSVLLVHVVSARARVVTNPDAKILDLERALLMDDIEGHNLASGFLDFSQLLEEIPESGLGNDGVGCENTHAVEFGGWVVVSWQMAANDLVFLETTWK